MRVIPAGPAHRKPRRRRGAPDVSKSHPTSAAPFDVDEAADIGFPVYARGATARTARGRIHEQETGGTVSVGGLSVNDGDYVVIDSSGAAFFPASRAMEVLIAAERIATKEAVMTKSVLGGARVSEVMGMNYENLLAGKAQ
jgi:4-hydroxy-4-methyl-2-oxoglutarate aldolase